MTHLHIDNNISARKRQEIGLSPRRATASEMVTRPPEGSKAQSLQQWMVIGLIALVAILTLSIAATRVLGSPATTNTLQVATWSGQSGTSGANPALFRDEFTDSNGPLVRDFQPDRWSMGVIEEQGVYRIRMLPGVIAWSTLGQGAVTEYRFSTSVQIPAETPWGYAGIVGRVSSTEDVYMVQIDGTGRLRVQILDNGNLTTVQDWLQTPEVEPAGNYNQLTVEDTGTAITVFANGSPVWATESIDLPVGDVGVFGASATGEVAEANFDWVALESLAASE